MRLTLAAGAHYWELTGTERHAVSGRPLTDAGLPWDVDRVDAAFVWGHNRRAYVISGSMYWKLVADAGRTLVEAHTYPRDMSMWAGVPIPVDGALTYTNGTARYIVCFFVVKFYLAIFMLCLLVSHCLLI